MNIVVDASPLIGLARIDALGILCSLFDGIIVPPTVVLECTENLKKPGAVVIKKAIDDQKIDVYQEKFVFIEALSTVLGRGESEAISLAVQLKTLLLIDDRRGRFFAQSYDVLMIGLGGLLMLAKKEGIIQTIKPVLNNLHHGGYRLSEKLVQELLHLANERVR